MYSSGNLDFQDIFSPPLSSSTYPQFLPKKRRHFDCCFSLELLTIGTAWCVCVRVRQLCAHPLVKIIVRMHCCWCRKYWMECAAHFFLFCCCCCRCFFILHAQSSINTHFLNLFMAKVGGLNELNGFVQNTHIACVYNEQFTRDSFGKKRAMKKERKKERKWHLRRLYANCGSIWNSSIRRSYYRHHHHHIALIHHRFNIHS